MILRRICKSQFQNVKNHWVGLQEQIPWEDILSFLLHWTIQSMSSIIYWHSSFYQTYLHCYWSFYFGVVDLYNSCIEFLFRTKKKQNWPSTQDPVKARNVLHVRDEACGRGQWMLVFFNNLILQGSSITKYNPVCQKRTKTIKRSVKL